MKKLLIILYLLAFLGCQEQNCLAPEPVMFDILYYNNNEVNLMNEIELEANGLSKLANEKLRIFYINDEDEINIDYNFFVGAIADRDTSDIFNSIIYPDNLIKLTGDGSQEFYFELGGKIDTLFFNVNQEKHPECKGNVYDVLEVSFNGLPVEVVRFPSTDFRYYYLESNKH